jgi:hypothetical protein
MPWVSATVYRMVQLHQRSSVDVKTRQRAVVLRPAVSQLEDVRT